MFIEFFDWFCNSLKEVFVTMDKFILFDNFSFFDFSCAVLATSIIFRILKLIMLIEDEEANIQPRGNYITQYDGYTPRHAQGYKPKHAQYQPKHAKKKWSWFR